MTSALKKFVVQRTSQVSIEFIILTGGVLLAAITFYGIYGSITSFANVTSRWVDEERASTIAKITR